MPGTIIKISSVTSVGSFIKYLYRTPGIHPAID